MELRSKRNLIASIAETYKGQYTRFGGEWREGLAFDPKAVYAQLLALPKNATESQVTAIIGESWTKNICSECRRDVEATVMLGEELGYESYTAWVCPECLKKALELLKGAGDD